MFVDNNVMIRPVSKHDLEWLLDLRALPSIWSNLTHVGLLSIEAQQFWFDSIKNDCSKQYHILFSEKYPRIGLVRFDMIDYIHRSMRVGGDIHPEFQNNGYGKKMYGLIKKYCFHYFNMNRIWLFVLNTNEIAINLYKCVGFQEEGRQREAVYRNGKYLDYIMMSILRSEYEKTM